MSDFDKEAEREKLREKYERDQEKREATEQMSELLLKGATMTNAHCGSCGDPIFRYDGQEFCPTCEEVVTDPDEDPAATDDEDPAAADSEMTESESGSKSRSESPSKPKPKSESTSESEETTVTVDTASETDATTTADAAPETMANRDSTGGGSPADDRMTGGDTGPNPTQSVAASQQERDQSIHQQSVQNDTATERPTAPEKTGSVPDTSLTQARDSLSRTVTRLARQAEATDDLARARAYLAATEEAADALRAVKEADR